MLEREAASTAVDLALKVIENPNIEQFRIIVNGSEQI
jgi:hypothetical protein